MTLYTDGPAWNVPAQAREVFDVSGAGDTVIAVMAVMLARPAAAGCRRHRQPRRRHRGRQAGHGDGIVRELFAEAAAP